MTLQRLIASLPALTCIFILMGSGILNETPAQETKQDSTSVSLELRFKTPEGWETEQTSSNMRIAQYKLPKAQGDGEDASLVLYYFGPQQGGSVQANVERWIGQMKQPETEPIKPRTETLTVNGLKITMVDVAGTYTAETSPGNGTFYNKPGFRLLAAVIETPKGQYFVKLVGPTKTLGRWERSYMDYVRSFEFK